MSEISHSEVVERLGDALGWDDWTRARTSGDLRDAVEEAEAEIARRGLVADYLEALMKELFGEDDGPRVFNSAIELPSYGVAPPCPGNRSEWEGYNYLWAILTAPPDVRVRAMLRVLEAS